MRTFKGLSPVNNTIAAKSSLVSVTFDRPSGIQVEGTLKDRERLSREPVIEATMNTLWDTVKEAVRANLPGKSFALWIRPITLLDQMSDTLVLGCPNKFSLNWIMENYLKLMEEKLHEVSDGSCKFILKVMSPQKISVPPSGPLQAAQLVLPNVHRNPVRGLRTLNHEFTFDRFVVGKCNELAYSASRALALENHFSYNPLFILANTGLGKSHLSQAVGHTLIQNNRC